MKNILKLLLTQFFILIFFTVCYSQSNNYRILYNFSGGVNDGSIPNGTFVKSGQTLYGVTQNGGTNDDGTIFRIGTDGTNYKLLYSFDGINGRYPCGSLVQSGSGLYGMTWRGKISDNGTVFGIDTNGSNYRVLHGFAGGSTDGFGPSDSPILFGSNLFGNTHLGGIDTCGVIYKIKTDGTGYQILHHFRIGSNDGQRPIGSLIQYGSVIYGTTVGGGSHSLGTIFKINTDGTGFQLLHSFNSSIYDGVQPDCSLTLFGSTLYGTTSGSGNHNLGIIFRINVNGSGFHILHNFAGGVNDGSQPSMVSLIKFGSNLYGTTYEGGSYNQGVIFQVDTAGSGFQILHSFAGAPDDGASQTGTMFLSDLTL